MKASVGTMIVGAVLLQGCMTSYVEWVEKGAEDGCKPQGVYSVSGSFAALKMDNGITRGMPDAGAVPREGTALPIQVNANSSTKETTGALATINNVFSFCTLGIWPYVDSTETKYTLEIEPPAGLKETSEVVVGKRRWSSFLLPIGALPCPGWGDARGFSASSRELPSDMDNEYCLRQAHSMLSGDFYEKNMRRYIALKKAQYERKQKEEAERLKREKEWREKKAAVAKEIQTVLSERERRRGNVKEDHRAIVLLDMKDVQDRTSSSSKGDRQKVGDISSLMDELQTTLIGLGFRVIDKRSIGRSLEEQALFNSLSAQDQDSMEFQSPAYRVEVKVFQYGVEETKGKFKIAVKEGVKESETQTMTGRVEFSLNFVNMRTGETTCSIDRTAREVIDKRKKEMVIMNGTMMSNNGKKDPMVPEKILAQATKEVFQVVAKKIVADLKPLRVEACTDEGRITLDASLPNLKQGDLMQMYVIGKKGSRRSQLTPVARVRVCEVGDDSCEVEFESIDRTDCGWNVVVKPIAGTEDSDQVTGGSKRKKK